MMLKESHEQKFRKNFSGPHLEKGEARKFCVVHWKVFAECRISPRQAHHWTQLIKSS
jgi:hypothetical protein